MLQLWAGILQEREEEYASAINEAVAPLNYCVVLIDCTKIRITGPGRNG